MKNSQKGGAAIILIIIILLVIGGGVYFYSKQNEEIVVEDVNATSTDVQNTSSVATTTEVKAVNSNILPDSEYLRVIDNPNVKILAKGDIDLDGTEDAILSDIQCGASCGTSLLVVFNKNGKPELLTGPTANFAPAFYGSSAAKSAIPNITIKNGIITLTGQGLDCMNNDGSDFDHCTEEKWNIRKSVTYKFDGKKVVQLSVNSPEQKVKIIKGIYEFSEFTTSPLGSNQTWVYKLNIKQDGGLGLNSLNIDGFQQLTFFYVNGVASGENLDIVFDSYGEGNMGTLYKKGDVLFTLKPRVIGLGVEWKKMSPNLDSSKGGAVFKKVIN